MRAPVREEHREKFPRTDRSWTDGACEAVRAITAPVGFDVYACTQHLRTLAQRGEGMRYAEVVPLGELPVKY